MRTTPPVLAVDIVGAAEALSVRTSTVRRWASEGAMPKPVELNGTPRWLLSDLERWLEQQRETGVGGSNP